MCREGRCINVAHARHRRILAPRRVTRWNGLHLEPEMIDSGYGILLERTAGDSLPECPAVSYGNNTRGVGLKSQRQSAWRLPERWRVMTPSAGCFLGHLRCCGLREGNHVLPLLTIRWLRASATAPTHRGPCGSDRRAGLKSFTRTVATWNAMLQNGGDTQFYRADDGVVLLLSRRSARRASARGSSSPMAVLSVTSSGRSSIMTRTHPESLQRWRVRPIWSDMHNGGGNCGEPLHSAVLAPETAWVSLRRP